MSHVSHPVCALHVCSSSRPLTPEGLRAILDKLSLSSTTGLPCDLRNIATCQLQRSYLAKITRPSTQCVGLHGILFHTHFLGPYIKTGGPHNICAPRGSYDKVPPGESFVQIMRHSWELCSAVPKINIPNSNVLGALEPGVCHVDSAERYIACPQRRQALCCPLDGCRSCP